MLDSIIIEIDEEKDKKNLEKYATFYQLEKSWLNSIVEGKTVWSFFEKRNYKDVAIYGMGDLGNQLSVQLTKIGHDPALLLDKSIFDAENDLTASKRIDLDSTDVIVVTPITEYLSIKSRLKRIYSGDIVSLEEVIRSM